MSRALAVAFGMGLLALAVVAMNDAGQGQEEFQSSRGFHPLLCVVTTPEESDLEPFVDESAPSPEADEPAAEVLEDSGRSHLPGMLGCGWFFDAMAACDAAEAAADARRILEVGIRLEGGPAPGENKLAVEAQRLFLRAKPMNPGRRASFPRWRTIQPPDGKAVRLIQTGWLMQIHRVKPIPGGWQARVFVYPRARTEDRRFALIHNFHIEVYSFKDGELTLDSEALNPDPTINPADSLTCNIQG